MVEDLEVLLPFKFLQNLFSGCIEEVENVSTYETPGWTSWVIDKHQKQIIVLKRHIETLTYKQSTKIFVPDDLSVAVLDDLTVAVLDVLIVAVPFSLQYLISPERVSIIELCISNMKSTYYWQ